MKYKILTMLSPCIALATVTSAMNFEALTYVGGLDYENGANLLGSFSESSGGVTATFNNNYNASFDSWTGFAYSKATDVTTPGFSNQYSAFTGSGAGGSTSYGLGYAFGIPTIDFSTALDFSGGLGLQITNTTYAALSMMNGDSFAKKFGGVSGDDADFFRLSIEGFNSGDSTGSVDFYLADYRFSDNSLDYIISEWTFLDLSNLGSVDQLQFSLASSDVGSFGINTPTYFAIDNLAAVPEASTVSILFGVVALLHTAKRRRT